MDIWGNLQEQRRHEDRLKFEREEESKRLQFQAEQESKRLDFESKMEAAKAHRDWITIAVAAIAVIVSVIAVVFAGLQWKSSNEALQITQRPWLAVLFVDGSKPWVFHLKNVGLTVAQDLTTQVECIRNTQDSREPDLDYHAFHEDRHVLLPGEYMFFQCVPEAQDQERLLRNARSIAVTIRAHYKDIFGKMHKSDYCVYFESSRPDRDFACLHGNFAD